jgi:hypothetical protein
MNYKPKRRLKDKLNELTEFYDSDTPLEIWESSLELNEFDLLEFRINSDTVTASSLFHKRADQLCDIALTKAIDISRIVDSTEVYHLDSFDLDVIVNKPFPKSFRREDTKHYSPLFRNYIEYHMDLMDSGFHCARDERMFYQAVRKLANNHSVNFVVRMFEHAKDYWGKK